MAIKSSTGLRNHLLSSGSLKNALDNGFLKIYAGAVPADADAALGSATLLCTISVSGGGTGLTFDAASGGAVSKAAAETWQGTNVASGSATFYRFVTASDTGASSTTEKRLQGTVGAGSGDLSLSSVNLTASAAQSIDAFSLSLPVGG